MAINTQPSPLGDAFTMPDGGGGDGSLTVVGTITANGQSVTLPLNGQSSVFFDISGSFTGTLQYEFLSDSGWIALFATTANSNGGGTQAGSGGRRIANVAGMPAVRVTAVATITGTASIVIRATHASSIINANVQGANGRGSASSGNPILMGARGFTTNPGGVATGNLVDFVATTIGVLITRPYTIPEAAWSFAPAAGGITTTPDVAIASAPGAGLRRYLTSLNLSNNSATGTEFVVKDGASTVIARFHLPPNAANVNMDFPVPLAASANVALNVACLTAGAAVFCNAQGFTAP